MSITDLDESYGKFDYIVCHGVFSWVPDFVKEAILDISKKLLSANGVAFVSYNTLPGWNMTSTVRELMRYHAGNFPDNHQKVQQARLALNFLNESLEGQTTPHAEFLKSSAQILAMQEDAYIRGEYLGEENKAFYFHEFVTMARKHSLEYIGDADLHRMFTGNLPPKAAEALAQVNDIVRTEQYIDFIRNGQFRSTMLCHNNVQLNRNIGIEVLKKLNYTANLTPSEPENSSNLDSSSNILFYINGNKDNNIASNSPITKAILYILSENLGNPLSVEEIITLANKKLPKFKAADFEQAIAETFGRLVFSSIIRIMADKPKSINKISAKPKITSLALAQAKTVNPGGKIWFTNQINQPLPVQPQEQLVVSMLDGAHSPDQIRDHIVMMIKKGDIKPMINNEPVKDEAQMKEIASALVNSTLEGLRLNYALIA